MSNREYSRKYIGEEYITNEGYKALVVGGGSKKNYCTIEIKDWISEVVIDDLKNGSIKYPYHSSVRGIGYIGEGIYEVKINGKFSKAYKIWSNMIDRCYDPKSHKRCPTYIGCSVDPKWHNYQVFSEWFYDNYVEGWELDKDLLIKDNKVYSEDMCVFIPKKLNSFLTNKKKNNTSGYIGVSWCKSSNKWKSNISNVDNGKLLYLGLFKDVIEASNAYKKAREKMSLRMREILINNYSVTDERILNSVR